MRDRLAFLHIPKSAGVSCRHAFTQHYSVAETVPWQYGRVMFGGYEDLGSLNQPILIDDDVDLSSYRYMVGHFALPTLTRHFDPADVVCILREPRARLLSHYTFWRSWDESDRVTWTPYDVADLGQLPLVEFLDAPEAAHQIDNLMTRLIVGDHPLIPIDGMIADGDRNELAELGMSRIEALGFVDVLERGETTFAALEAWFGSPMEAVQLNKTNLDKGPPLTVEEVTDPNVQALLNDRTAIDLMLWKRAATMTGMPDDVADVLAERTGTGALVRLVERTRQRSADAAAHATAAEVVAAEVVPEPVEADRLPAPQRLLALIRRGPTAIGQRVIAQIEHQRRRGNAR